MGGGGGTVILPRGHLSYRVLRQYLSRSVSPNWPGLRVRIRRRTGRVPRATRFNLKNTLPSLGATRQVPEPAARKEALRAQLRPTAADPGRSSPDFFQEEKQNNP